MIPTFVSGHRVNLCGTQCPHKGRRAGGLECWTLGSLPKRKCFESHERRFETCDKVGTYFDSKKRIVASPKN